jgi:predicted ATPase/class 3 adenylate cyclase
VGTDRLLTFVMTDVVGSVALWERNRAVASEAIALLEQITESLTIRNRGVVHKKRGEGDSFFLTFENPTDALHFAAEWQTRLQNEPWPSNEKITCRMAIRTGFAESREGDYFGVPINRCARMRSLAGRRQVVICSATYDLVRENLPAGTSLESGGEVQLRDVETPEHLFLLRIDGIESDHKLGLGNMLQNHNMPPRLTSFVGRGSERERIESSLRFHRLITLLGPGGSGKTRISEEIAESFSDEMADGAWFVGLADCRTQADIELALFRSLRPPFKVPEPTLDAIVNSLMGTHALLVVDNCEHLVKLASKAVRRLLSDCPRIRILATSRSPLGLTEEKVLPVGPFDVPRHSTEVNLEELKDNTAVQLFLARAASKDASLELTDSNAKGISRICQRLDGIALAIEQAASHARRLSVDQIADRLEKSFSLLKSVPDSVDPRHETMIATIEWSVELQSEPARNLFFALGNMVGSWPLEGAPALGAALGMDEEMSIDAHGDLIDGSLVQRFETPDAGTRYRLLETVREYALLKSPLLNSVQKVHMNWCLSVAERADQELLGPNQAMWLRRLEWESGNLKQALEFAFANNADDLVHMTESLKRYWVRSGLYVEGAMWLERALSIGPSAEPRLRASMLNALGACRWRLGESDVAEKYYRESLALYHAVNDEEHIAAVSTNLAICVSERDEYEEAISLLSNSLDGFKRIGDLSGEGSALMNLGHLHTVTGAWNDAESELDRAIELLSEYGHPAHLSFALGNKAKVAWKLGDVQQYKSLSTQQLRNAVDLHDLAAINAQLLGIAENAKSGNNQSLCAMAVGLLKQLNGPMPKFSEATMAKRFANECKWLEEKQELLPRIDLDQGDWPGISGFVERLLSDLCEPKN